MLYRDEILDHYRHPQNFGHLKGHTHQGRLENASCGDEIMVELMVKDGRVADIKFTGRGCAISVASASLLTEHVKGKTLNEVRQLGIEDIVDLIGEINPGRQKCARLPLNAITLSLNSDQPQTT